MKVIGMVAGLAAALMSSSAFAGVIFSNPYAYQGGDCAFSTTCAATLGAGDDFAAQEFTVSKTVVVTSADFIVLDYGVTPKSVNWDFIRADGPSGLPGALLAAGTDTLSGQTVGYDGNRTLSRMSWNVGTVALGPGSYYLAIQAISPVNATYLGGGALSSGAADTQNAGVTWAPNYETYRSVAVDIYGAVPEPGMWALMIVGLAATGALLRRRQILAAA